MEDSGKKLEELKGIRTCVPHGVPLRMPDLGKPYFLFDQEARDLVLQGRCPLCKEPISVDEFKDACSVREFSISGMCQKCQDHTFRA